MRILKAFAVAFSMYSRIPMPRFNWASEDMKYHLIFFPLVGAVIGALEYGLLFLADTFNLEKIVFTMLAMAIPVIVTGGFHVDGFMDTSDALASWGDKEKRLEILKDSHVGAFAIIRLITLGLILFSAIYSMNEQAFVTWCFAFYNARIISGICVVRNKKAKEEGILSTSAKFAADNVVLTALIIQFVACCGICGIYFQGYWTAALVGLFIALLHYIYTAYSKFGGITGDLAGWFVCKAETLMAVFLALLSVYKRI